MNNTSKYIQINDYLLIEYRYAGTSDENISNTYETWKITNNITNTYQFINGEDSKEETGNVADWSSSKFDLDYNSWVLHDTDGNKNLLNTEYYDLEELSLSTDLFYDTVKIHILAGFTFDGIDGLITEVLWPEKSTKNFTAANYVYLEDSQIQFSTKPLFLGERYYNRYFEFKVPSLFAVQEEWNGASDKTTTFAHNYSYPINTSNPNPAGYTKDALVSVIVHEISTTQEETFESDESPGDRTTLVLTTSNIYTSSFNISDEYKPLSLFLGESSNGDYFEYFGMWNGEFIDDYIEKLNSSTNGDWAIINEIDVFEHIGTNIIKTGNFTSLQENNFNAPNLFRPIIKSANEAYAFSLDYTMRLFDRVSTEQIIRKASVTSYEPKKYGRDLIKIGIDEGFRPIKIYNKILNKTFINDTVEKIITVDNVIENVKYITEKQEPIYKTKYVNNYIQNFNISVDVKTDFGKGVTDTIYGQGEAPIFLTPFDNVLRFKVLIKSKDSSEMIPLNLEMNTVYLAFDNDLKFESKTANGISKSHGDLQFIINKEYSQKLLGSVGEHFYIISDDGDLETVIYKGNYFEFADFNKVNQSIKTIPKEVKVKEVNDRAWVEDFGVLKEEIIIKDKIIKENELELKKSNNLLVKLSKITKTDISNIVKIPVLQTAVAQTNTQSLETSSKNWFIKTTPSVDKNSMESNVFDPTTNMQEDRNENLDPNSFTLDNTKTTSTTLDS